MAGSVDSHRHASEPADGSVGRPRRSVEIDLLRILCASLLFYYHTGIATKWPLYEYATFASGTFIALAGYCAVRYSRYREALRNPTIRNVGQYFFDRFLSVYPAYAAITLILFAGSYLYPARGESGPFTLPELACNLLMINQYVGMRYFTEPMWFVPFILQLYLLMPALYFLAIRLSGLGIAVCSLASLGACIAVHFIDPVHAGMICKDWSPVFRLAPAFLGIATGVYPSAGVFVFLLLAWLACSGARFALLPWFPGLEAVFVRSFYSAIAFVLLLTPAAVASRIIEHCGKFARDMVTLMGKATLPFFLSHGMLIHFLWAHFGRAYGIWIAYFVCCWIWSILFTIAYIRALKVLRHCFHVDRQSISGSEIGGTI
ncbi:MAG TPA: acyltransferase [Chthoniobacterales bacterium]